ncbi:MAG TPA: NADP-dependent oxidoreductase [Burkholderiales bacterium]|jgi:NADPH-dependent curcumin reductase CurA|nr:NADP-dependent oxidoreductase [Burkholderiales bacterium]
MQVLLASRPRGPVDESHFRIVESDVPKAADGEFVVRAHYLSLDPYMRGRMDDAKSYAAKAAVGDVMVGTAVGEVIESRHEKYRAGDFVETRTGWQLFGLSNGGGARKVDPNYVPLSAYLGAVGMPGVTAWIGLNEHGRPKAGETVVVSAASGAVGSVVGQLAKLKGCKAVGIAGGRAKCDYVVNELGFDACIDYKAGNLDAGLDAACAKGVDIYYDNVGGPILDTVLGHMNAFSRIPLCGLISGYDDPNALAIKNFRSFLVNRIQLRGFICSDHLDLWKLALKELATLVHEGKLRYRESIAVGLENAPKAFIGLLKGQNFGKQLVKLI